MLNFYISISRNKRFVLTTIVVLFVLIVSHMLYFEKFSRYVVKNDLSAKLFHTIEEKGKEITVASIGTSHTADGLSSDAKYFFNYGRSGTWDPQVTYAKVSHLIKNAPHLKVLLLEVDHISILTYDPALHTTSPEQYLYLLKHVNEALDEEKRPKSDNDQPVLISLQEDVAPVIHRKYFQNYLTGRGKKKEETSPWAQLTSKEKIQSAKKRIHSYRIDTPSKIDKAVRNYYTKAIEKAKAKGVKVYLIYYPQTKEYMEEIDEENHKKVDDFVTDLVKEKGVKVLDYRHLFASDELFFENQDHVNEKGSEALTEDVMRVIENDL